MLQSALLLITFPHRTALHLAYPTLNVPRCVDVVLCSSGAARNTSQVWHTKSQNPQLKFRNSLVQSQVENSCHHVACFVDNEVDCVEEVQQEVQQEKKEQLEDISRRLIIREEELFSQDSPSEEDEDQLQKDFEDLRLQICMAIHNTFTPSSSTEHLEVLRSAVASIQQQEVQDRHWTAYSQDQVPRWRPQKCLSTHNILLQNMVESRLTKAAEDDSSGGDKLSSAVKRQVCRMGKRVKEDLLSVVRTIKDYYPPQMDILNVYAGLYHRSFSARLTELAASGLETEDCSYLLFWVNHYYPLEILKHEELDGQIKTACLGSLLLKGDLNRLEEQYLAHKEDKVKQWLNTALKKEEESWLNGRTPELIDCYYFSPLAVDVIQVRRISAECIDCEVHIYCKPCFILSKLQLWTSTWVDGTLPVVDSLLDSLNQQLADLIDLKPNCRQVRHRPTCLHVCTSVCTPVCLTHLRLCSPCCVSSIRMWSIST
uniref:Tumor necrosis factor alpha-induced protein 2-like n=1 Tax=Acanthochromis polyacanthus TaxID=80966 RepID=A0A3Q1EZX8_9TELE